MNTVSLKELIKEKHESSLDPANDERTKRT